MRPGVSVAAVALAHELNANMLRKWVIDAERRAVEPAATAASAEQAPMRRPSFVPLALAAPPVDGDIRIELQRAGT